MKEGGCRERLRVFAWWLGEGGGRGCVVGVSYTKCRHNLPPLSDRIQGRHPEGGVKSENDDPKGPLSKRCKAKLGALHVVDEYA